jgi:hypothetical protein
MIIKTIRMVEMGASIRFTQYETDVTQSQDKAQKILILAPLTLKITRRNMGMIVPPTIWGNQEFDLYFAR